MASGVVAISVQFIGTDNRVQAGYEKGKTSAILTLAVLDDLSTRLLAEGNQLTNLTENPVWAEPAVGEFAGTKALWESKLDSSFWNTFPMPVRRSLRIFERRVSLP